MTSGELALSENEANWLRLEFQATSEASEGFFGFTLETSNFKLAASAARSVFDTAGGGVVRWAVSPGVVSRTLWGVLSKEDICQAAWIDANS